MSQGRRKHWQVSILAAFALFAHSGLAQIPPQPEQGTFRVTPINISENRIAASGSLDLAVTVSSEASPAPAAVRRVIVTRAIDDKERTLLGGGIFAAGRAATYATDLTYARGGPAGLRASIALDPAPRNATSIKVLEGVIELLVPTEASLVRIANITSHSGLVENPILTKHGIIFHFFADQAAYEYAKERYPTLLTRPAPAFPNQVGHFQIDPSGIIAGLQFQDARGAPISVPGLSWWSNGTSRTGEINLTVPLPKDAQLVLFLAVPGALKAIPFRLENISLP